MKKKLIIVVIVLVVIFGGIYGWHWFVGKKIQDYMAHLPVVPASVNVETVKAESWHTLIPATGSVRAKEGVTITPEIAGKIVKIYFTSGQLIEKGQPILALNGSVLAATLEGNKAQLLLTKTNYERQQTLYRSHVASTSDLDSARAQYQQAEADVAQTTAQLRQTIVRAPFTGMLGLRQVDLGQYLQAGDAIVNLQMIDPMQIDFSVSEKDIAAVVPGLPVVVTTLAYPHREFEGTIMALDSQLSTTSRSVNVRAMVDNKEHLLKPGMFVSLNVVLPQLQTVVAVPQIAVTYSTVGDVVYAVKDGKAERVYVTLGARRDDRVAVLKGLTGGEQIVYAGQSKLRDGAPVVIETPTLTTQLAKKPG